MEALTADLLEEFQTLTKFPIFAFFKSFDDFLSNDYKNIISYYSGNITNLDNNSFKKLNTLKEGIQQLFSVFSLNKNTFIEYKWWILIEQIEKIDNLLMMIDNTSKWLRSTISRGNFNPNPEVQIPFNQGQTLESISRETLGSTNWSNTWVDLALKNDLREEDYTSQAGFLIKANFNFALNSFVITAIVDNPVGERVLGIDLDKKLQFVDNDFKILPPRETFAQTIQILIYLRKGDNPEFPDQGIEPKLIVGSNVSALNYPILFRQLTQIFRTDDTVKSFSINSINRDQDAVFIEFQVESQLGTVENISLSA